jgi:hypothetical protein
MKLKQLLVLCTLPLVASLASAAEKIVAGPKGGRLLDTTPKAEFFVTPERKVEITFYDASLKATDPGAKVVVVNAEPAAGRQAVEMEKTASGYVSKAPLPAGEPYRLVVQVKDSADAKPKNFRIDLNLANCDECDHPEYACTCGH